MRMWALCRPSIDFVREQREREREREWRGEIYERRERLERDKWNGLDMREGVLGELKNGLQRQQFVAERALIVRIKHVAVAREPFDAQPSRLRIVKPVGNRAQAAAVVAITITVVGIASAKAAVAQRY